MAADPTLTALSAAFPALSWTQRRRRGCTRYYGRSADYAFPLVRLKHEPERESSDCFLQVPHIGVRFGWARDPVAAVRDAVRWWRESAQKGESAVSDVFGAPEVPRG